MHILQLPCPNCRQRHYVDPFKKLSLPNTLSDDNFTNDERVVLWGAGEICIKMLDNYPVLKNEKFTVVDNSKSRQGYSVCEKKIVSPAFIDEFKVKAVILTVVRRRNEIMRQLASHPSIEHIYLPRIRTTEGNGASFTLEKV